MAVLIMHVVDAIDDDGKAEQEQSAMNDDNGGKASLTFHQPFTVPRIISLLPVSWKLDDDDDDYGGKEETSGSTYVMFIVTARPT